jgi:hypothetical protein
LFTKKYGVPRVSDASAAALQVEVYDHCATGNLLEDSGKSIHSSVNSICCAKGR